MSFIIQVRCTAYGNDVHYVGILANYFYKVDESMILINVYHNMRIQVQQVAAVAGHCIW